MKIYSKTFEEWLGPATELQIARKLSCVGKTFYFCGEKTRKKWSCPICRNGNSGLMEINNINCLRQGLAGLF